MPRKKSVLKQLQRTSKRLPFTKSGLSTRSIVLFILIFGAIGTYFIWRSFAVTSAIYTGNNLDVNNSRNSSIITETTTQSKRNSTVVLVTPDPTANVSRATLVDATQKFDPGIYTACFVAFAPNGTVNGLLETHLYSSNTVGTTLGEGGYNLNHTNDYSKGGCIDFTNSTQGASIAVVIYNQTAMPIRIGHTSITRIGDAPAFANVAGITPPSWLQSDCTGDTSYLNALGNWLSGLPDNAVVNFPRDGCYLAQDQTAIEGKHGLTIHGNGATLKRTVTPPTVGRQLLIENSSDIKVDGLKIVGPKNVCQGFDKSRSSQHGIAISNASNVEISNVNIRETNADFIYIVNNSSGIKIHNNDMWQAGRQGFAMVGGSSVEYYNNINDAAHRYSVDIEPNGDTPIHDVSIHDNAFWGPNLGFLNGIGAAGSTNVTTASNALNASGRLPGCNK